MAITDINISEQLQTDAPSIKYTGNEGPQASPQHQQEQMIARQIWDALGPEQQGQFQSFEQFFQSGIWKQILQQMQADEGQGPGPEQQQGIGSLGPQPMQQQMPMPNRMGAEYGGRMGYQGGEMVEESIVEKLRPGSVDIIEKIKEGIIEGGDRARGLPGMDESIWIEKLIEHLRKKRGGGEAADAYSSMGEDDESAVMQKINYLMREHGLSKEEAFERVIPQFRRSPSPERPEEIEEVGIESLRGEI
jgi:hypothetical protein